MQGEEGVRRNAQQGAGGGSQYQEVNLNDIFGSFFGQGGPFGGGGGFGGQQGFGGFNFGPGGPNAQQQKQQKPKPKEAFEDSKVTQLNLKSVFKLYKRQEIWVVLAYNSKEGKLSDKQIKEFNALADEGVFSVAAVNCKTQPELCEELGFDVKASKHRQSQGKLPLILIYGPNKNDSAEIYKG
jgi:hypothetical protein